MTLDIEELGMAGSCVEYHEAEQDEQLGVRQARMAQGAGVFARGRGAAICVILGVAIVAAFMLQGRPPLGDETLHLRVIRDFTAGRFRSNLPMFSGYHALMAGIIRIVDPATVRSAHLAKLGMIPPDLVRTSRIASTILGLLSVLVFYLCARTLNPRSAPLKTLQFFFLPVLFPLFFLVFTDPLAILMMLLSTLLYLSRRYTWSGLVGGLGVLTRQTNITWVALLFVMIHIDHDGANLRPSAVARQIRRGWSFIVCFAGFVVFVALNHGLVMKRSLATFVTLTGPIPLHTGALFTSLVVLLVVFLPLVAASGGNMIRLLREHAGIAVWLLGLFGIYMLTFTADHVWNVGESWYLRNRLVAIAQDGTLGKALFFLPVAVAILFIVTARLYRPSMFALYTFWAVALVPIWLIEPRYMIPPLVLFLLFRREEGTRSEMLTLAYEVALSAWIYVGTLQERFFL